MSFGKRTAAATLAAPQQPIARPQTRRGGYWLAVVTVPTVFVAIALAGGLLTGSLAEVLTVIPPSALSLTVVAAVVLISADLALRRLGCRKPWVFAVVCGFALYALCFVTPLGAVHLILFALVPGFSGGWVLGWSRR